MASSSSTCSLGTITETPLCKCGTSAAVFTSRTDRNPGRRFAVCSRPGPFKGRACNFWDWIDPECCIQCRPVVNRLVSMNNDKEAELIIVQEEATIARAELKTVKKEAGIAKRELTKLKEHNTKLQRLIEGHVSLKTRIVVVIIVVTAFMLYVFMSKSLVGEECLALN